MSNCLGIIFTAGSVSLSDTQGGGLFLSEGGALVLMLSLILNLLLFLFLVLVWKKRTGNLEKELYYTDMALLFQTIMDNLPYPIFTKDVANDFKYLTSNRAFAGHVGRTPEGVMGKSDFELFEDRANAEHLRSHDLNLIASHQGEIDFNEEYNLPDKSIYYCHSFKKVLTLANGKRILLGISIDISKEEKAKKILEAALAKQEEAIRAKSFFYATMSHEIRTPLNAIIGFSDLLQEKSVDWETARDYMHNISIAGHALLDLINDLLDLSKIESDRVSYSLFETDFVKVCREVFTVFQAKIEEKNLKKSLDIKPMPFIYIDTHRVRQILFNLLGNAVKFTHQGEIKLVVRFVETSPTEGNLFFSVEDTGIGISEEDQKILFEPFVQSKSIRGSHVGNSGTGLGLAISRRLILQMGGNITLESQLGKGSKFQVQMEHVKFSVQKTRTEKVQGTRSLPAIHLKERSVLVVDDVKMNLSVMEAIFSKMQIPAVMASNGKEALAVLEHQTFGCVITDLWMPEMNGSELAREIRKKHKDIFIVALSADTDNESNFDMKAFDSVLFKPVTLKQIKAIFAEAHQEN